MSDLELEKRELVRLAYELGVQIELLNQLTGYDYGPPALSMIDNARAGARREQTPRL